jgi:hypothetical protein
VEEDHALEKSAEASIPSPPQQTIAINTKLGFTAGRFKPPSLPIGDCQRSAGVLCHNEMSMGGRNSHGIFCCFYRSRPTAEQLLKGAKVKETE